MILNVHPGSRIRILFFLPIPDPGDKKAMDPGTGSATPEYEDKKPTDDLEVSLLLPAACVYSRLALCSCCSQYCLSTTNKK
jgi:hypothetical protein